jgi:hypothetical protein
MYTLIGGLALVLIVLGLGSSARGVQKGIEAFEDPGKPETPAERDRANSDMLRLLVLLASAAGLLFVLKMGGAQ